MSPHTEFVRPTDQALPIDLPLKSLYLGVGDSNHQIESFRAGMHDLRHRLDHRFQALASIDQPERANHLASGEAKPCLLFAAGFVSDNRHAVRNDANTPAWHA